MLLLALVGGVVVFGGTVLLVVADRARAAERKRPRTAIAAVDGTARVRVQGTVQTRGMLVAPYSQRPCVYYKICVRIDATEAGFDDVERGSDFDVRDDSGTAHVLAERARFDIATEIRESDRASNLSPAAHAMFATLGIVIPSRIANVEVREGILGLGSAVDIVGHPVCEPSTQVGAAERGYRETSSIPVFSNPLVFGPP